MGVKCEESSSSSNWRSVWQELDIMAKTVFCGDLGRETKEFSGEQADTEVY